MRLAGIPALAALAALLAPPAHSQELEQKCLSGHAESCARVAQAAFPADGSAKDLPRAAIFSLRACASAEPDAPYCRGTGAAVEAMRSDAEMTRRLREGLEAMGKACEGGRIHECNALGMARLFGTAGEPDPEAARALFTKACDGGASAACANLADLLAKGGAEDRKRAITLYGKACSGTAAWTCKIAGLGHVEGVAGEKDLVQAARAFKRGCDGRDPRSCMLLFSLYQQDPARARELFRKACAGDFKQCGEYESLIQGAEAASRQRPPQR